MRLGHKSVLEVQDGHRERGRVHQDLPLLRQELDEVLNQRLELGAEKLVSLIHGNHVALLQVAHILVGKVENTTWGSHHYMDLIVQTHNVLSKACAACWDHALDIHVFSNFFHHWRRLQGQLSRRDEDETLDCILGCVALLKDRDHKCSRLSCTVLCSGQDWLAGQSHRQALFLNRGWLLIAHLKDPRQQLLLPGKGSTSDGQKKSVPHTRLSRLSTTGL